MCNCCVTLEYFVVDVITCNCGIFDGIFHCASVIWNIHCMTMEYFVAQPWSCAIVVAWPWNISLRDRTATKPMETQTQPIITYLPPCQNIRILIEWRCTWRIEIHLKLILVFDSTLFINVGNQFVFSIALLLRLLSWCWCIIALIASGNSCLGIGNVFFLPTRFSIVAELQPWVEN